MPYLNIDDGEDEHPKIIGLSDAAYRLRSAMRGYAARNKTDGLVMLALARRLTDTASDVVLSELEKANLIHFPGTGCSDSRTCCDPPAGYVMVHDYLEWNHSKRWWENRAIEERKRKAAYRKKKAQNTS